MNTRDIHALAQSLRHRIGRHYRAAGVPGYADKYQQMRRDSDEAEGLAKYLIQHLDSRHDAVRFAAAVGMPGYIHTR